MYRTSIGLMNDEQKDSFTKICNDIAKKDETFKFYILTYTTKKFKHQLIVLSEGRDQAFQRGQWLISKTGYHGLLHYNVSGDDSPKP